MRKTIYTNMMRSNPKYLIWYNVLRFSPLMLLFFALMVAWDATFQSIVMFVLSLGLFIYRLKVFNALHEIMHILELEIDGKQINLVTDTVDYPVAIDDLKAIGLRIDPMNNHNLDIYFQIHDIGEEDKMVEWPEGLIEQGYIRVPMIFEDHSLTIIEDHSFLLEKCRNYEKMKNEFSDNQDQMKLDKTIITKTVDITELND